MLAICEQKARYYVTAGIWHHVKNEHRRDQDVTAAHKTLLQLQLSGNKVRETGPSAIHSCKTGFRKRPWAHCRRRSWPASLQLPELLYLFWQPGCRVCELADVTQDEGGEGGGLSGSLGSNSVASRQNWHFVTFNARLKSFTYTKWWMLVRY